MLVGFGAGLPANAGEAASVATTSADAAAYAGRRSAREVSMKDPPGSGLSPPSRDQSSRSPSGTVRITGRTGRLNVSEWQAGGRTAGFFAKSQTRTCSSVRSVVQTGRWD